MHTWSLALLAFDFSITKVEGENYRDHTAQTSRYYPHGFWKDPHSQLAVAASKFVAPGPIIVIVFSILLRLRIGGYLSLS